MDLDALVDRVPRGWTRVRYDGRGWALTRSDHAGSRTTSIYAEELGGRDVVSANVYRTGSGPRLRPCEMPAATVLAFLVGWRSQPGDRDAVCTTPTRPRASSRKPGHLPQDRLP